MLKIIHLADLHIGSSFSHGFVNPKTGINTRLEDFVNTLSLCIDRAINEPVDLVLFAGDAFPDATPAPYIQEAFASQFRRLADADIPTVLLVGNHDQHSQGLGGVSLSIYRTLGVMGFLVGDSIETHLINTKNGQIQIITLPWINRSTLLTRPETEGLSLAQINELIIDKLKPALEGEIRRLDPNIPSILLGHLMADKANLGAEKFLAVGKGFNIPVSLLTRPELDYVALGHVHKHQNLNKENNPPIIYPGSIERVDFSEEKEDKGYVFIELEKGQVNWEFYPLPARKFVTVEINVCEEDEPEKAIVKAIKKNKIEGAVVRLIYQLRSEQIELINLSAFHEALQGSHSYTIKPELVSQLARPRLPELGVGNSLDPLEALKTYLDNREDLREIVPDLLEAAEIMLEISREDQKQNIQFNII
jgi:DNA repair protein SbcD/Mre11